MYIRERLEQNKQYIIDKYNSGVNTPELSREFNCNTGTIYLFLKENNVVIRHICKTYTQDIKTQIIQEYLEGAGSYILSKKYNISKPSILRWLRQANVIKRPPTANKNNLLKDKLDLVKQLHEEGKTQEEIAQTTGHSSGSVCVAIQKLGLPERDWKYHVNEHFFDKIDTEEKAYVLGWFYSDGCVDKKGKLRISLNHKDREILEKIRDIMSYTGPLYENPPHKNSEAMVTLCINRKTLADKLIDAGCMPNKSLILHFPSADIIPSNLVHHFVRGYFDGDGSISISRKRSGYISVTSTDSFNRHLQNILLGFGVKSQLYYRYKNKNTCSLMITYRNGIKYFLNYIYKDASIFLCRKQEKAMRFLSS